MVTSCAGWIEPLNLQCLLVNTFAGTMEIFMFVAMIAIATISARFRMINMITLIMYGLFAILMAQYIEGIYFLAILIIGLVVSFGIGKIAKV
tara:strand:- start:789 stop:1064 length:276 start_codon:yes stop_codon:yes gene_type:complete